jgi:hypothetical protein
MIWVIKRHFAVYVVHFNTLSFADYHIIIESEDILQKIKPDCKEI